MIKECSMAFLFLALLQGVIGYYLAPSLVLDAILFAVFTGILYQWKSRIAAIILLLLSLASVVVTLLTKFGYITDGGQNIFLAVIMLGAAIRSVEATFKLESKFTEKVL